MAIDLKQFLPYVEHCDLTEDQKFALLEDLWSIVSGFVDEAWGLCPTQHFTKSTGQFSGAKPLKTVEYYHADNSNEPLPQEPARPVKRQR